jgi:hypothetical protein
MQRNAWCSCSGSLMAAPGEPIPSGTCSSNGPICGPV